MMTLTLKKDWPEKSLKARDQVEFTSLYTWWYVTVAINGSEKFEFPIKSISDYFLEEYTPEEVCEKLDDPFE